MDDAASFCSVAPRFKKSIINILLIGCIGALTSCDMGGIFSPITDGSFTNWLWRPKKYTVVRGDTLYSIAFRYDLDYRKMALYNHLKSPYTVKIGQVLYLTPYQNVSQSPNQNRKKVYGKTINYQSHLPRPVEKPIWVSNYSRNVFWQWPAKGYLAARFSPMEGVKGVNIAGKKGDPIYAAASGVVAYEGSGLPGYGNLIIIRHSNQVMTAYGNNLHNKVRVGNQVRKGQVIADMGVVDRKYWGVHFEIRRAGKPVNPLVIIR